MVDRNLDPANGIRVSESVMSKGKLTEASREGPVGQDPSIVNMDTSPSGTINDQQTRQRIATLNQSSGDIPKV